MTDILLAFIAGLLSVKMLDDWTKGSELDIAAGLVLGIPFVLIMAIVTGALFLGLAYGIEWLSATYLNIVP